MTRLNPRENVAKSPVLRSRLRAHFRISRVDHLIKNVFVLPGILISLSLDHSKLTSALPFHILLGLLSVCLVSSSNYVLNEVLDATSDREHPSKRARAAASGEVNVPLAYCQWIVLMLIGVGLARVISVQLMFTMLALWAMGCVYNVPPLRTKDLPYLDVLTEAVNNPIRLLAGWYITRSSVVPPISLVISYWMIGCYFMAIKRYAEYREFTDPISRNRYRKSFSYYTEQRLLISVMFYGSHAMLFFGAFIMRYRFELILAFPLVAVVMATYLSLAFQPDSPAQRPESLHRDKHLMVAVVACAAVMILLLFVDIPALQTIFPPSISSGSAR